MAWLIGGVRGEVLGMRSKRRRGGRLTLSSSSSLLFWLPVSWRVLFGSLTSTARSACSRSESLLSCLLPSDGTPLLAQFTWYELFKSWIRMWTRLGELSE